MRNFNWSFNESLQLCILKVSPTFDRVLTELKAENSGSSESRAGIDHGLGGAKSPTLRNQGI